MPIRSNDAGSNLFRAEQEPGTAGNSKPSAWIAAHCDGGARGNPGPAGYGALIQAADGSVIAELSEFLGNRTNNFAEYSGLLGCLQYALDHNYSRLRLVSDSELMVKQIQGKYQVKSPDLKPLYDEAKRRIAKLDEFEISHALRHKNKDADRLANEAMDRGTKRTRPGPSPTKEPVIAAGLSPSPRPAAPSVPIVRADRAEGATARSVTAIAPATDNMLRGFTRDGVVHVLGAAKLPEGIFVKIIRE